MLGETFYNKLFGPATKSPITDPPTPKEVDPETRRANWILLWIGGGLVVSIIAYIVLHRYNPIDVMTESEKTTNVYGFWATGVLLWVELAFWGWFGTLAYLLSEIHQYYPTSHPERHFCDKTPWYFSTAIRGPFIALLILIFLTSLDAQVFGVSIVMGDLGIEALIFLAAVLGFFSRVAREQLQIIVEKVFADAWKRAQPADTLMHIEPKIDTLDLDTGKRFTVVPDQDVIWALEPERRGKISEEGFYTAPPDDIKNGGKRVFIIATSVSEPQKTATMMLALGPATKAVPTTTAVPEFVIQPEQTDLPFGQETHFTVEPETEVQWSIAPSIGTIDAETGRYQAPKPDAYTNDEQITIKATAKHDLGRFTEAQLTLTKAGK